MYEWFRTPYIYTINPNEFPTVDGEVQVTSPLVGYSDDFKFIAKKTYDVTESVQSYLWRFEDTMLGGVGNGIGYTAFIEVQFTREYNQGYIVKETVENRFGTALYDPDTGELVSEASGDWELYSVRDVPPNESPTTHFTVNPPASSVPGTYELRVYFSKDGVLQGPSEFIGKYDMRDLWVENVRAVCPFDPLEGPGTIEFDLVAYPKPSPEAVVPNGWAPESPVAWEIVATRNWFGGPIVWNPSGTQSLLPGATEPNGRVAHVQLPWAGTDENGDFLAEEILMDVRVLSDLQEPGNVFSQGKVDATIYHRQCPCEAHQSEAVVSLSYPMGNYGPLSFVTVGYRSLAFCRPPSSFGYGWSSLGSSRVTEPEPGVLILRTDNGLVKRWHLDDGTYVPVRDDNHEQIEINSASSDARFVVTFRDQTVHEFASDGRLRREVDRNGNSLTYSYSGNQLLSIADSKGHILHYSYDGRTDGQPTEIRAGDFPNARVVTFEYYSNSHLVSPDRLSRATGPGGEVTEFVYDERGRLQKRIEVRPSRGNLELEYEYGINDRLYREYVYGLLERVHQRSDLYVSGLGMQITSRPLAPNGEPLPEQERTETFVRDKHGRIVEHYINRNIALPI